MAQVCTASCCGRCETATRRMPLARAVAARLALAAPYAQRGRTPRHRPVVARGVPRSWRDRDKIVQHPPFPMPWLIEVSANHSDEHALTRPSEVLATRPLPGSLDSGESGARRASAPRDRLCPYQQRLARAEGGRLAGQACAVSGASRSRRDGHPRDVRAPSTFGGVGCGWQLSVCRQCSGPVAAGWARPAAAS
jgi:hypothetical protein